jgi:hypothetical protein
MAAKNKYDNMVEKGIWNAPTAEEKIVALEAKLTSTMKTLNKKVSFELGKKGKVGSKFKGSEKKNGKQKGTKGGKGGEGPHPKNWPVPKAGDKKTVEYKGHDWHWCGKETGGKCEKWRAHNPKECQGAGYGSKPSGKRESVTTNGKKSGQSASKKLKVAKAYVAKLEKQDEGATDDSSCASNCE